MQANRKKSTKNVFMVSFRMRGACCTLRRRVGEALLPRGTLRLVSCWRARREAQSAAGLVLLADGIVRRQGHPRRRKAPAFLSFEAAHAPSISFSFFLLGHNLLRRL